MQLIHQHLDRGQSGATDGLALETQLAASRATAAKLLDALVAELTGTTVKNSVSSASGTGRRGRPRKSS